MQVSKVFPYSPIFCLENDIFYIGNEQSPLTQFFNRPLFDTEPTKMQCSV